MSHAHGQDRSGQGLTEYALLIATVSLGLILLLGSFRNALGNVFRNSRNQVQSAATMPPLPATSGSSTTNSTTNNSNNNNNNNNNNSGNNGFIFGLFD